MPLLKTRLNVYFPASKVKFFSSKKRITVQHKFEDIKSFLKSHLLEVKKYFQIKAYKLWKLDIYHQSESFAPPLQFCY